MLKIISATESAPFGFDYFLLAQLFIAQTYFIPPGIKKANIIAKRYIL